MPNTQQPAYRAFCVTKRDGTDDFWLPIGVAFAHQSGDGYNVILQALPIPNSDGYCKIVLRPPKDKDDNASPLSGDRNNRSISRRR